MLLRIASFCALTGLALAQRQAPRAGGERPPRVATTTGMLRQIASRELILEADDHRIVWFTTSRVPAGMAPGDRISVVSEEDNQGRLSAVSLKKLSSGPDADRALAARTWDLRIAGSSLPPPRTLEPNASRDAVIEEAWDAAGEFAGILPSFSASQTTTRSVREDARHGWSISDVVTADLVYKDHREVYSNIKIDNKPAKSMEETGGMHSTGEFGSVADEVLDPHAAATFRRDGEDTIGGRAAWRYRFEISRERSRWSIRAPSQLYYSGYGGSLWIDKENRRILRLEQDARDLPQRFPFDIVEISVNYALVRLDGGHSFLLPVEAEALDCQRGTSVCMKNHTEFRNYVKFGAESNIVFPQ